MPTVCPQDTCPSIPIYRWETYFGWGLYTSSLPTVGLQQPTRSVGTVTQSELMTTITHSYQLEGNFDLKEPSTIKAYLIKWPLSVYDFSREAKWSLIFHCVGPEREQMSEHELFVICLGAWFIWQFWFYKAIDIKETQTENDLSSLCNFIDSHELKLKGNIMTALDSGKLL